MRWNSCIFKPAYWTAINNSQDQPKSTGMTTVFKAYVLTTQNSIGNIESKMQNNKVDKQAKKDSLWIGIDFVVCLMFYEPKMSLSIYFSLSFLQPSILYDQKPWKLCCNRSPQKRSVSFRMNLWNHRFSQNMNQIL